MLNYRKTALILGNSTTLTNVPGLFSSIVNIWLGIIAPYGKSVGEFMRALWRAAVPLDRSGATAIEYAMVALLISIAAFSVLVQVGTSVSDLFTQINAGF